MRRATEDYIIDVYLNQKGVSALLEEKQSFISRAHLKTLIKQEGFQMLVLGSRGLFQPIQGFVEFKNIVRKLGIFKTRGLPHITSFSMYPFKKASSHPSYIA
jgi:hypothetical protein